MAETDAPVLPRGVIKRLRTTTAVEALTWAPKRGQITAPVGLNGVGKSTAMRGGIAEGDYAAALGDVFVPFIVIEAMAVAFFPRRDVNG